LEGHHVLTKQQKAKGRIPSITATFYVTLYNNNNNNNNNVQTDRTIPNNKPDIKIRDNEERTYMLIDVAISRDRNVIKKEAERILKYKDLTTEIQRMW
jgi:ribosome-associated translation inhibitor RaiA